MRQLLYSWMASEGSIYLFSHCNSWKLIIPLRRALNRCMPSRSTWRPIDEFSSTWFSLLQNINDILIVIQLEKIQLIKYIYSHYIFDIICSYTGTDDLDFKLTTLTLNWRPWPRMDDNQKSCVPYAILYILCICYLHYLPQYKSGLQIYS